MASCISYLTARGNPSTLYCGSVKNLKTITPTTVDIQAACDCVKAAVLKVENEAEPRSTHVGIQATKEDVCTSKVM